MTRAVAQTPSDLVLSSTTEPQEALDHAVSENWKEPFIPAAEKKAAEEAELAKAKALLEAQETPEEKEAREAEEAKAAEEREAARGETDEDKAAREKEEKEGKGNWSKRVNKLTARNARIQSELEQERTARQDLERRLAALERGEKPGAGSPSREDIQAIGDLPNKPKRIDFKDEETYVEKLIQWTKANEEYKEGVQAEQEHVKEVFKASRERMAVARERYDDWDEAAKGAMDMTFPFSVSFAIDEMSNSADVLYHIAKHPEVYAKMAKMSPNQMIIEAGRISDKLAAGSRIPANANGNGSRKPRPQVTEPITPGGRRTTAQGKKLEDMSAEEYIAARRQMRAARRAN